jgi:PAS domain S-box-containing protein
MAEFKITPELKITIPWKLILVFLFFSFSIILAGILYYKSQKTRIFKENENNLTAIASLKIKEIEQWHSERLGDASIIMSNKPLIKRIRNYYKDENQVGIRLELTKWMESVSNAFDFNGVLLIDTLLKSRLSVSFPDSFRIISIREKLADAIKNQQIILTDMHRAGNINAIHMDLLIPLIEPGSNDKKTFGVMIIRINPDKILFPLIQAWPTPSKSSETLLVRNEGDSILYLNELRHRKNTALNLKLPLSNENLLASKAGKGYEGVVEGVDYRNIPVLGHLSGISGLPWYIVAKVDKEEINAPLKRYLFFSVIVIVLLILINGAVLGFWIWEQHMQMYRLRLKDEITIRESEDKFKYVFDNSVIGKSITMPTGEIQGNRAFSEMLGYTAEELKKTKWQNISYPDDIEYTNEVVRLLLSGENASSRFIKRYIHKNGSVIWADVSTTLRRDDDGNPLYFLTTINNITDLKRAEDDLRKLNEELEQRVIERTAQLEVANKELEAFSYSVSHDLRAPLRAVHSYTKILLEDYVNKLDGEGKRLCGIISFAATQMEELIDDLLSFSRIGRCSLNPSLLDMKSIASAVLIDTIDENGKSRTHLKMGRLHKAHGDVNLIRMVWNNLISNAIKYSSKETSAEIIIGSRQDGDNILYYVKDNGVGFDMQYKHKLFGVFQRLHSENEFEGNGVGLAIVQRIILRHGGRVWAEGEVGKGATFYFSLPVNGIR